MSLTSGISRHWLDKCKQRGIVRGEKGPGLLGELPPPNKIPLLCHSSYSAFLLLTFTLLFCANRGWAAQLSLVDPHPHPTLPNLHHKTILQADEDYFTSSNFFTVQFCAKSFKRLLQELSIIPPPQPL